MSDLQVIGNKDNLRKISKTIAIKEFFGMDAKTAFAEIKPLMQNDPNGFIWMAQECAKQLGAELSE